MSRPKFAQELIHVRERGGGARVVAWAAVIFLVVALSLRIAWQQFHGPVSEHTLAQAELGRQLARGEGFTTKINYPQTAAFLQKRGQKFAVDHAYPDLHQAPLYPLTIALG